MAWDVGLVEAHSYIKCSSILILGPGEQFSMTKGSGLLLSQSQTRLSGNGHCCSQKQREFFLTLTSRIFNLKNVGSFLLFMEAITQWDGYVGVGVLWRSLAVEVVDLKAQTVLTLAVNN